MVTPITYIGYDQDGKQVCTCTAEDANNYLNPSEVQKGIENVEDVLTEQIKNIRYALYDLEKDAETAIIVQGTKMTQMIEDICTDFSSLPGILINGIDGMDGLSVLYDKAEVAHDQKQNETNETARNKVKSTTGVVRVSP